MSNRKEMHSLLAALLITAIAALTVASAQAQTFSILYNFKGRPDGANPYGALVEDASGNLYGTTQYGGTSNLGIVFKVDPAGNETVLHSFAGGSDGATPLASVVVDPAGNLYGTTWSGGANNAGVVFKVDASGSETILHTFTGQSDGGGPRGSLILDSANNLYGTTIGGGNGSSGGVVFKLDPTGQETVLYAFTLAEGGFPEAGLLRDSAGNLYGTTTFGGGAGAGPSGTVFKLDSAGNFSTLHAFSGGADGGEPTSVLIQDKAGNLYGTTQAGGIVPSNGECFFGCGVVFKLDSTGKESVLYSFTGSTDGANPYAGVVQDGSGNLYGTTAGISVIFKLNPAGNETVLYTFAVGTGLAAPFGGVIQDSTGNLFGAASFGSSTGGGSGVVLKLVPPGFSFVATVLTPSPVTPGGSATATFNTTAVGGFNSAISLTCSVQPQPALAPSCSLSPNSAAPGVPVTLTVSTAGPSAAAASASTARGLFYALSLPLIGLVVPRLNRKRRTRISAVALACLIFGGLASGVGCGGGGGGGGSNLGTPAGTYTITIAGTSASSSVQNSTTTTLTVN